MQIENQDPKTVDCCHDQERRQLIKKAAVSATVLAGCSFIPNRWISPKVGLVALPSHAATSAEIAAEQVEYNTVETFSLKSTPRNNKPYTWLPQTGSYYGGEIKFEFEEYGEMIVPDASKTYGADGDTSNHNQMYYFCGTDFQPGESEYNHGKASVFGPPNSKVSTVTLYYNK